MDRFVGSKNWFCVKSMRNVIIDERDRESVEMRLPMDGGLVMRDER